MYERHKRPQRATSKLRKQTINLPSKKKTIVSVALSAEDRNKYEMEGAMVYYSTIIENKISRGEEVTDEDLMKLDTATDAYEELIRPELSLE